MKIKEQAVKDTILELNRTLNDLEEKLDGINFNAARNGHDIMREKRRLLITLADGIEALLLRTCCYFCQSFQLCEKCSYGKIHGICDEKNSSYEKMKKLLYRLEEAFQNYYTGQEIKITKRLQKEVTK